MPLSRSSTLRTKSRSPAPSTSNLQGDLHATNRDPHAGRTQRQFLPPAHYAAAGGYLSPEHAIHATRYAAGDMDFGDTHRGYAGQGANSPGPLKSSGNNADVRSDIQTHSTRDSTRRKVPRESVENRNGFSNIEPQVVPSLRDTIDRTTAFPQVSVDTTHISHYIQRKPSRVSFAPTASAFRDETMRSPPPHSPLCAVYPTKHTQISAEKVSSFSNNSRTSILPDSSSPSLDRVHRRTTKRTPAINHVPLKEDMEPFISTGPILRLPVKPALKNNGVNLTEIQNNTYSKNDAPSQHSHPSEPSISMNPLRTVRSLLSRKNSNSTRGPSGTPTTPQMASKVKDGSGTILEPPRCSSVNATRLERHAPESVNATTLQQQDLDLIPDFGTVPRTSSRSSTSSKSPYKFKSHIPRRTHHTNAQKHGDYSEDQASVSIDDSDFEIRCELERKSARKLMVANGRPDISDSGSIMDSTSTATSGSDIGLRPGNVSLQRHMVEDEDELNEGTSLDDEILRHLDSSLYTSSVRRNDSGVGLGVSVSPVPYYQVSPQMQHRNYEDNTKQHITQSRMDFHRTPESLPYSPIASSLTASSRPSASPRHASHTPHEKSLRFSLPPSDSGISTYSDENASGLEAEHNMHQTTRPFRDHSEERQVLSEWNERSNQQQQKQGKSVTGIAAQMSTRYGSGLVDKASRPISPTPRVSSPRNLQHHTTKYDSCDSEYGLQRRQPSRKGTQKGRTTRPRSASVGPQRRSLATEDEDEQTMYIPTKVHSREERQPPRPMSACQLSRRKNRSKERDGRDNRPASQVFPAHLRDLIRDRTNFAQDLSNPDDLYQGQPPLYDEGYDSVSASEISSPILSPASAHQPFIYGNRYREPSSSAQHTPVLTPRPKFHPPQPDLSGKDLRSIAARERLVLGIPPSESDEAVHPHSGMRQHTADRDGEESSSGGLSHAESDMSSLNQSIWQAEEEQRNEEDGHRLLQSISRRVEGERVKDKFSKSDQSDNLTTPRLSIISPTESGSSSCEGLHEQIQSAVGPAPRPPENRILPNPPQTTSDYALNPKLGPHTLISPPRNETHQTREAVIQELFESEETLLHLLHICVENFILPLRVQNSSTWISGVPSSISKLLDWFDDIVHLHEGVHAGLCAARDMQTAESERVSEVLRECFILRVEVYMPYFMRIDDVLDEVAALVGRQYVTEGHVTNNAGVGARKSEFGQFILLQEREAECQGWSLDNLLRLPLRRLEAYQNLFAKMLQLTPKSHQDYLSTLSLSRSTDVAMQVMMEVKFREDEYRLLKSFSKRIQAPSSLDHLPTRERRLLFSGPCLLLRPGYLLSSVTPSSGSIQEQSAGNYVPEAGIQRSDSMRSANSLRPNEGRRNPSSKSSWLSLLPRRKRNKAKCSAVSVEDSVTACGSLSDPEEISSLEGIPLYAFVFNDLILLAHAHDNNAENAPWHLFEHSGIVKPISVSHLPHPKVQVGSLVSMDVIVLDIENLNDPADNFSRYSHRQLDLVFTPPSGSTNQENLTSDSVRSALTACRSTVIKWLSIPKYPNAPGGLTSYNAITDHGFDTEEIVSSLVASGLPLPKSPSGQVAVDRHPGTTMQADDDGDEREERGWWSLCYQRSMRELQRKDWCALNLGSS